MKTPIEFSNLIGNETVKQILKRYLNLNTLPQVLLFYGPEGVGKKSFAQAVAKSLTGQENPFPDTHLFFPDEGIYSLATLRSVVHLSGLSPYQSNCQFIILNESEKISPLGSNILLKLFEEPPFHTYFILITHQLETHLPTLLSRCYKVRFLPIADETLGAFIRAKEPLADAARIIRLAEGSVGKAIQILQSTYPFSLEEIFNSQSYTNFHQGLKKCNLLDEKVNEQLIQELIEWVRHNDPVRLEEMIPLAYRMQQALAHHLSVKTVLEYFFFRFIQTRPS